MAEISVIVPVYKVEPYLRRCVDSILAQTFPDIEVILVDDGSPDGCPAICDEYARLDKRVKVIHQKNGGLSAARNAGLDWVFANSDSQWISFVDSDDWVHPQFLEYLHRAAVGNEVSISVCGYSRDEQDVQSDRSTPYEPRRSTSLQFYHEWVPFTVVWNKLYSRDLFAEVRFPIGKISEDGFVSYKLLYKCGQIMRIHAALYFYRQTPGSIMQATYSPARLAELEGLQLQREFFHAKKEPEWEQIAVQYSVSSYMNHIKNCSANIQLHRHAATLRRELRALLRKNKVYYRLTLPEDAWICEELYPRLMNWYWKKERVKALIEEEGVTRTAVRITRRVLKRAQSGREK